MKLVKLTVREPYSSRETGYKTEVEFENSHGNIKLKLGDEVGLKIVEICADEIVAATSTAAQSMVASVLEGSKLLEIAPTPKGAENGE